MAPENTQNYEKLRKWYCKNCKKQYQESLKNRLENNINCKHCKPPTNSDTTRLKNIKKSGSLKENYPKIAEALHPTANLPLTPETISHKTNNKYWWKCKCEVEWYGIIDTKRNKKYNCKHCGYDKTATKNKQNALKKNKNITITHPIIAKEFNEDLNLKKLNLTINEIHSGSQQKIWWSCNNCKNNYRASPYRRIKDNSGCNNQECINEIISSKAMERAAQSSGGILKTHPIIAAEWDYTKNILNIKNISYGSSKKAWWRCSECGHSWQTIIKNRIKQNSKCPRCSDRTVNSGVNDFQTLHKNLMKYYVKTINSPLKPNQVKPNSHEKALWRCGGGHESIKTFGEMRVNPGCRHCKISLTQKEFTKALQELLLKITGEELVVIIGDRSIIAPKELDVVIPDLKLAIEYNGDYWHGEELIRNKYNKSSFDHHYKKFLGALEAGYILLYIWESDWNNKRNVIIEDVKYFISTGVVPPSLLRFT